MLRQALKCFWFSTSSLLAYFWQCFHSGNISDKITWQAAGKAGCLCGRKPKGSFVLGGWEQSPAHSPGYGCHLSTKLNKGLNYLCTMSLSYNIEPFFSFSYDLYCTGLYYGRRGKGSPLPWFYHPAESVLCDKSSELGLSISLLYHSSWPLLLWVLNVLVSLHSKRGRQQYAGTTYRCVTRIN